MKNKVTIEDIGELVDKCESLLSAASIVGVPDTIHKKCLVNGIDGIMNTIKDYYISQTGENPWVD